MAKRALSTILGLALVAGVFTALPAKAQSTSEVTFYLHSTGCSAADTNFDYLSIVDGDNEIECFYTASGIRNEVGNETGTIGTPVGNAVSDREAATRYWDNTDGGPITLDASRPITGEIYTMGGACVIVGTCAPVGAGVGEVILDITIVGKVGDEETELGAQTDEFIAVPGGPHQTVVEIQPDSGLTGTTFDVIELRTWIHGASVGHGVVKTNGDASSFIAVPTMVAEEPATEDPPKKKKKKKKKKANRSAAPMLVSGGAHGRL